MTFDMPGADAGFAARGGWLVRRLMVDLALTMNQAAGVVGNLGYESGGFKKLQEIQPLVSGSRGGYGWVQWTGPRRRAFEAWCAAQHLSPASDQANYGYLLVELRGAYAYVISALRRESTLERCVFVVGRLYEGPYGTTATHLPGFDDRLVWARRAVAGALQISPSNEGAKSNEAPPVAQPPSQPKPAPVRHPMPAIDASDAEAERLNADELSRI